MKPATVCLAMDRVQPLASMAAAQGLDWLSASERARLAALQTPLRREQFLSGRWLARQALAKGFGDDAGIGIARWSLSAPPSGPPRVQDLLAEAGEIHLSLSHSGDHVACAVSGIPVGIDLEVSGRPRQLGAIAELICTPQELARLQTLHGKVFDEGFYDLWTLKEAWIKLHAESLSPARMARIQTQPQTTRETVNARLWRGKDCTLALASSSPLPAIRWLNGATEDDGQAWHIEDMAASLGSS